MAAAKKAAPKAADEPKRDVKGPGTSGEPGPVDANAGTDAEQVAARSQDVDEQATPVHRKVFVIPKNPLGDDYGDETHTANIDAMRQAMILQGLRPTEDGHFVGAEDHPDGQSVCLTYACAAVPAATATPEQSQVRVTVDDQHALDRQTAGLDEPKA